MDPPPSSPEKDILKQLCVTFVIDGGTIIMDILSFVMLLGQKMLAGAMGILKGWSNVLLLQSGPFSSEGPTCATAT